MLWLRYSALVWLFRFRDTETDHWEGFVRCTSEDGVSLFAEDLGASGWLGNRRFGSS